MPAEEKEKMPKRIKMNMSAILRAMVVALLVLAQFALVALFTYLMRGFTVYFYVCLNFLFIDYKVN